MSTADVTGAPPRGPHTPLRANRTLNVVRMQFINKQTYIWIPLMILGGAFVLALAIYAILAGSGVEGPFRGSHAYVWTYVLVHVANPQGSLQGEGDWPSCSRIGTPRASAWGG